MALDYQHASVYFRDSFVPFTQANVSIASSSVLYGLSVYTVFNVVWNEDKQQLYIFRLKDHYRRLINSARIMDFHSFAKDWPYERFEQTMHELLKRNKVQENVLVRVTIFIDELIAGTKIHGLKNSLSAYVYPMGEILPKAGAHVGVSSWVRAADNAIPARAKVNGNYVNASLMKNEALLHGYDDAIALDQYGHVAEGTVANLFLVRGGQLITPDLSTDILEGITRDTVLTLAQDLAMPVSQRAVDRTELYIMDELFFCGSSAGIVPIISVDKRSIGSGKAGEVTQKLAAAYGRAQNGLGDIDHNWLTTV